MTNGPKGSDGWRNLDMRDVGGRILEARIAAGFTVERASVVVGGSEETVNAIEEGRICPAPADLIAFAMIYGRPVSGFLFPPPDPVELGMFGWRERWKREHLTEGQVADLMGVDRLKAREMINADDDL